MRRALAEAIRDFALLLLAVADRIQPAERVIVLPLQPRNYYEGEHTNA